MRSGLLASEFPSERDAATASGSDVGVVQVMDGDDIRRAITRIAHEIVEKNHGVKDVALIGVLLRGVPLAERLAKLLLQIEGVAVPVGKIDIGLYRDDFGANPSRRPALAPSSIPFNVDAKHIIL